MTRRTLTPLGLSGAALAAGLIACPTWTRAAGLDVWNLPELSRQCDEEAARREYLNDCRDDLWRRNAVKRAAAAELAAGRLDLAGAAAEFLAAEEADPAALAALRIQYRDGPDLRRAARVVLAWARAQAGLPAGEVARLEAEFRALFPG